MKAMELKSKREIRAKEALRIDVKEAEDIRTQRTQAHENPRLPNAADLLLSTSKENWGPECDLAKTDDRLSRLVQPPSILYG